MTSPVVQAFAAVGLGLVVAAAALSLTFVFAPELRPFVDDPTEDDDTDDDEAAWRPAKPGDTPGQLTPQLDEEPSEVDPPLRLREERIALAGVDLTPYVVPGSLQPEPFVRMATNDPADDGSAVKVGNTWVHRSCSNARRDHQPDRICSYCRPRLAGLPIAGGTSS